MMVQSEGQGQGNVSSAIPELPGGWLLELRERRVEEVRAKEAERQKGLEVVKKYTGVWLEEPGDAEREVERHASIIGAMCRQAGEVGIDSEFPGGYLGWMLDRAGELIILRPWLARTAGLMDIYPEARQVVAGWEGLFDDDVQVCEVV